MQLPIETIYEILLHSSLKQVLNKCSINKRFNTVCLSKEFWKVYAKEWFWLDLPDNLTAKQGKELIIKAHKILKLIKYNRILLNYGDYLYLVFEVDNQDIKDILSYGMYIDGLNNLTDRIRHSDLDDKYNYDTYYDIPSEKGENAIFDQGAFVDLTEVGERNKKAIMREVTKPTLYTDGRNLFKLNYNNGFDMSSYVDTDLFEFWEPDAERIKRRILRFYLPRLIP